MDQLQKDIEILERYIENDVSGVEKEEVETRLSTEKEFKHLQTQLSKLIYGIKYAGRQNVLLRLKEIEASLPSIDLDDNVVTMEPQYKKGISKYQWMGIAASIVLIFAVGLLFFSRSNGDMNQLYAEKFESYTNLFEVTTRGENNAETLRKQAFLAYDLEDYEQAAYLFSSIPDEEKESSTYLYLGISYLFIDETVASIESFQNGLKAPGELQNQLEWYLGLAYLKSGEKENAISIFTKLSKSDYTKSSEAKEIVDRLTN